MLNMKLETGLALAAIALHAMFIAYVISFYIALSRPLGIGNVILIPWQLLIVGIFLFGLPGFGLAGISYILARRDVPRIVSIILIAQGILMPVGMLYSTTLTNNITEDYKTAALVVTPQMFLIAGFAPIGLGVHLATLKPMKRRTM
jgi:hypothetical protein